ncbi:MAG: hypothetical protein ACXQS8_06805 [Candidatus Helarchaeales archaeon]
MRYVRVFVDTTAGFQPATRSTSTGGIIGEASSAPTGKFLLTKPSGSEFDMITVGSPLYNAIVSFYKQPNTRECWCIRMPSANEVITGMVPSPAPNGTRTTFQLPQANITSISDLRVDGTSYTYVGASPGPGEFSASLTAGTVTLGEAPASGSTIEVDYEIDALQSAFRALRNEDISFLMIAGQQTLSTYMKLVDEVELASASGRYRMAVMSLPEGQALTRELDSEGYFYSDWPLYLQSPRAILVAHKIPLSTVNEDPAAAMMGTICGVPIQQSLTLRPVVCTTTEKFTEGELYTFKQKQVCVLDMPFSHTTGKYVSYGFTLDGSSTRKYIDQVRVYDDLAFSIESTLMNPNVIGKLKYNAAGFASLRAWIASVTNAKIRAGIIDGINYVAIPAETLVLTKSRTEAEEIELKSLINSRGVPDTKIGVDYRGAMEDLDITLVV